METNGLELKSIQNEDVSDATSLKMQKPKKVLHFSDGVLEEYSDSEDELDSAMKDTRECVNEKELQWAPYMRLKANKVGSSVLAGIDFVGGGLASLLGITASEAEIAAAKRVNKVQRNIHEEHCDTWNPPNNVTIVSAQVTNSDHANPKPI